jgi:hypothetical protein
MINSKYNGKIQNESFQSYCEQYLVNRIYKLLPLKEEKLDWRQYLYNLNHELLGAEEIYLNNSHFLSLVHKLESLFLIDSYEDYRRMIFECITVAKKIPVNMVKEGL